MEPNIINNSPSKSNLIKGYSTINIIDNKQNNNEVAPLLKNDNNTNEEKPSIRKHKYLKQVFFLYFLFGLLLMAGHLYALFLPGFFNEFVIKNYPNLSPIEQQSKSSYYKSFSDAAPHLVMFFFGPLFGVLSDRYGRKPILFFSFSVNIIDFMLCWCSIKKNNLIYFYIGHTISGLSYVANAAVFSFVADVSIFESHVSILYSLLGISLGSGIIFGPLIYIFTSQSQIPNLTLYIAGILVGISLLGLTILSESLEIAKSNHRFIESRKSFNPFKTIKDLLFVRGLLFWIILLFFSVSYISRDITSTFNYYTILMYSWTQIEIGSFIIVSGFLVILWGAVVIPILLNFLSIRKVISLGFFIYFICHLLLVFSNYSVYYFIIGCGFGSFVHNIPNLIQSLVSVITPRELQGTIITGFESIGSVSQFLGSFLSDYIFMYFISNKSPFFFPQAPYFLNTIFSLILFLSSIIIWNYFKNEQIYNNGYINKSIK